MLYLEGRDGSRVQRWPLKPGIFALGRDPICEIVVDDPLLSKLHLQLAVDSDTAWVRDQSSKNGVWVDGERVAEVHVAKDRWFAAGGTLFALREGVTLGSDVSPQRTPSGACGAPITLAPQSSSASESSDADTGDHSFPAWIARAANALSSDSSRDDVMHALLATAAQITHATTVALLREVNDHVVLVALHGTPLPPEPTFDALALRAARGELFDPASDRRFGVIEGVSANSETFWLVLLPALAAGSTAASSLRFLATWAMREAASVPRAIISAAPTTREPRNAPTTAAPSYIAVAAISQAVLTEVDRVATSELPVLFVGDSGTGKELLAQRIHDQSRRSRGPFIAVNCAAIPAELLEAELFGIEKGVATGVSARLGWMALANGGTLFLDEIGDMPSTLQPKLLRALETRQITPLGAPAPEPVDIRLVSATHGDLRARALDGRFRLDLYYRLAGTTIRIPSLRERPEDVLPLARRFADQAARDGSRVFSGIDLDAARLLLGYSWPGNVRELKHAIERAVAFSDGPILHAGVLPPEITLSADASHGDFLLSLRREYRDAKLEFERLYFKRLIERCGEGRAEAVRRSGLSRSQFYAKLAELGLNDVRIDDGE